MENTKAKLEKFQASKNEVDLNGLTKDSLTGAFLQANVQSYFAINDAQANIAQKQANIITNSYMSIGTFSTKMRTDYRYGIATKVTPVGLNMDIDRILSQTVNKDNDNKKAIAYNQAMGMLQSLNENAVPEMLMNTKDEKNVEGVSAVKAIQLATQQGQTLYTITKANYSEILPKLNHDSETMNDIRNAVNAGKVVTVHASAINHLRWHGTGYIITDPTTGAGAFMISGGFNGGDITLLTGLQKVFQFLGWGNSFKSLLAIISGTPSTFLGSLARAFFATSFLLGVIKLASNCKSTLLSEITLIGMTILTLAIIGMLVLFAAPALVVLLSMFTVGYFNSQLVSNVVNTRACKEG